MGFYQTKEPRRRRGSSGEKTGRRLSRGWVMGGAMVASALVGAGATLAVTPAIVRHTLTQMGVSGNGFSLSAGSAGGSGNGGNNAPTSTVNVTINDGITQVVKKVEPDVVAVVNYTTTSDFFSRQQTTQESDIGSGVFFYRRGNTAYVVTNNHVVQGGTKVEVVLQSGRHVPAKVVGTDPFTDLAVIKTSASYFSAVQPVRFANSADIQVGEPAIAIGNPMGLDFADSVTSGIVSGDQRMMPVEEPSSQQTLDSQPVIQTDAAINPGNSGGPLLNIKGQLIGINSSKIVANGFDGMGFAIPSNQVQTIASELIQYGYAIHPSLGIEAYDVSNIPPGYGPSIPVDYGVLVQSVQSASAKAGGLKAGDVIVAMNGQTIQDSADLRTALFHLKPGQTVQVTLYRGNKKMNLSVKIGEEKSPNTTSPAYTNNNNNNSNVDPFSGGGGSNPFSGNPFSNFFGGNPFGG